MLNVPNSLIVGTMFHLSEPIALIGDTKVIFLDEPTSGMDIDTHRKFILTLQNVVKEEHRSIVLTSHRYSGPIFLCTFNFLFTHTLSLSLSFFLSMTECEALCNRIGIMVDGQFKCIGSKEVLKDQ